VPDQNGPLDAPGVQVGQHRAGTPGESGGRQRAGPVSGPVGGDGPQRARQQAGQRQPVGGGAGLPVQQHQVMTAQRPVGVED